MKKTKTEKGITLIALIITIVVLLILAVVAIRAVQGDGIIRYAQNARDDYEAAQANENTILQNYLDKLNANNPNGAGGNDNQDNTDNDDNTETEDTELKITASTEGVTFYTIEIDDNGSGRYYPMTKVTDEATIQRMQTNPQLGDMIEYNGYRYGYELEGQQGPWDNTISNGWGVNYIGSSNTPGKLATEIFGKPLISMSVCFAWTTITSSPDIPVEVTNLSCAFEHCDSLTTAPSIPHNVRNISGTFAECTSLTGDIYINTLPTGLKYVGCFTGVNLTSQNITLKGVIALPEYSSTLQALMATANG